MNSQELKQHLESQYTLVCFEDLANITVSPYYVYNLFHRVYKDVFAPNERLVLYSGQTPSNALIKHLYRAANLIDISNFFIMIVAPGIQSVLKQNLVYSTDNVCFDYLDLSVEDCYLPMQETFLMPKTLCPMPWMHLEINTVGEVSPCCIYSEKLQSIQDLSLTKIFFSDILQQARRDLISGKKIPQCNACWNMENQGLTSHRQRHLQALGKDFLGKYIQNPEIKSLDVKPSNACNFKCRICTPSNSSLHAAELAKHQNIIVKQSNSHVDNLFDKELPGLVNKLDNIDFYGGEPFFIKQILNFVEDCVTNNNAEHLRLHFNTNGSVYPDKIEHCWKHFKHVDIQFSIDDMGKRFELQRGGSWKQVEDNIKKFLDLNLPNMTFGIMPAISIMNVLYLDELFEWADQLSLPLAPQLVEKPEGFSVNNLTQQAKDKLLDKYKNSQHPELQKVYSLIKKVVVIPGAEQKFKNKIDYYDRMRNESFQTSHNEIAKLMGIC